MNSIRTVRTSRASAARSTQLCRLAGCLSALALALPIVAHAQDTAPQPAASTPAIVHAEGKGAVTGRVLNSGNGMYLNKALVQIEGTNLEALTDDYGNFELRDIPAGPTTLKISSTGLVTQSIMVTIEDGKTLNQEFKLGRSKLTAGKNDKDTVSLDEFVVASERFKNAAEIAINEERYSPTIKNVVAADAFGDIPDGNIGEFVKYIPGVQVATGYDNAGSMNALDQNISQVSVRGFGSDLTAIYVDGVPLTNASPASLSRSIGLDMMSVNNASRVEVTKVPTPDMPSNSPGGAINLITRSAFEYSKPRIDVKFMMNMNSKDLDVAKKTPGPANKPTQKVLPGVDFAYTLPINSRLGVTMSGGASKTFYENQQAKTDYLYDVSEFGMNTDNQLLDMTAVGGSTISRVKNADGTRTYTPLTNAAGTKQSVINPLFYRFQATDTPNTATRKNAAVKLDLKPTLNQKVSIGVSLGAFETTDAQRRLQFYNGNKWAYTDWGDGYVIGAPYSATGLKTTANYGTSSAKTTVGILDPKATVNLNTTTRDRAANTNTGYIDYVFKRGPWSIDANINGSKSVGAYKDLENGHFSDVETSLTAGQLKFMDIKNGIPGHIELYDKTGAAVDWTKLKNWSALATTGLKAKSGDTHSSDTNFNAKVNVRRDLDFIPISWMTVSAKVGWYRQEETVKKWGLGTGYYVTYDAAAAGQPLSMDNYIDDAYSRSPGFNLPSQEWLDNYKLYKLWQDNPNSFNANSEQNKSDNYKSEASQQKNLKETSDEAYFQLEGHALKNRLSWVTGTRQTTATRKGYLTKNIGTWNFLHNANGTMWRDTSVTAYATGIKFDSISSLLYQGQTLDATTGLATGTLTTAAQALRTRLTNEGIWFPTSPIANNTLAAAKLQRIPFVNIDGKTTNKPNFMGAVSYDLTKDLKASLSYSKTSGRPDWENGVLSVAGGGLDIAEAADGTSSPKGTITQSNPDLKPSENDSYDAQLAYYTKSGGKFAVSGFYKLTKNPQETVTIYDGDPMFDALLSSDSINLNPDDFRGWAYKTTINSAGTGKTIGYELEAKQNLGIIGGWGKYFDVFSSFSHHYKKQVNTTYLTLKPTAGTHASGGINFDWRDLSVLVRGVWLEQKYISSAAYTLNGQPFLLGRYTPSTTNIDLNVRYQLTRNIGLFFNARNVLDPSNTTIRKDAEGLMPSWSRVVETKEYGVTMVVGVSANF